MAPDVLDGGLAVMDDDHVMPLMSEVAADEFRLLEVILGDQDLCAHAAESKQPWSGTTGIGRLLDRYLTFASYRSGMDKSLGFPLRQWALPVLVSAAALTAVAGCGAANSSANDPVASIPSSSSSAQTAASAAASTAGATAAAVTGSGGQPGVVERLDDTPQQIDAIISAWNSCLVAHGATYGNVPGVAGSKNLANIPISAKAACVDKQPVLPPQLNPASNPRYRADWIAEIACMRGHGVMVHLTADSSNGPGGLAYTYDAGAQPPANLGQIQQQCQLKAFGGGK